jgi:hypothetical protein
VTYFSEIDLNADLNGAGEWDGDPISVTLPDGSTYNTLPDNLSYISKTKGTCISIPDDGCIPTVTPLFCEDPVNGGNLLTGYTIATNASCSACTPTANPAPRPKFAPNLTVHRSQQTATVVTTQAEAATTTNATGKPRRVIAGGGAAEHPADYDSDRPFDLPVFDCYFDSVRFDTIIQDGAGMPVLETRYRYFNMCVSTSTTTTKGVKITSCIVDTIYETARKDTIKQTERSDAAGILLGYMPPTVTQIAVAVRATRFTCGVDSISGRDSIIRVMREIVITDTLVDYDTCRPLESQQQITAAALEFCWRGECTHELYTSISKRYTDSANKYADIALDERTNFAQNYYTDAQAAVVAGDAIMAAYYDSLAQVHLSLARAAEATTAAWRASSDRYYARPHTVAHAIDTLRASVAITLGNGCTIRDTATIVRIPIEYTLQPATDTTLQALTPVMLNAYASDRTLVWDSIIGFGNHGGINKPAPGHIPNSHSYRGSGITGTQYYSNVTYTHDTLDGDTFLFPITVTNTDAFDALYGRKAIDARCISTDTVQVIYQYGFQLSGIVSYNGHWHPQNHPAAVAALSTANLTGKYDQFGIDVVAGRTLAADDNLLYKDNGYDRDVYNANQDIITPSNNSNHLPIGKAYIKVTNLNNGYTDSIESDANGYYHFKKPFDMGVQYEITAASPDKGGVIGRPNSINANDAALVSQVAVGGHNLPINKLSLWHKAGNIDESINPQLTYGFNANDAANISQRSVGNILSFTDENGATTLSNWRYSVDTVTLTSDTVIHIRGIMRGDADRNYDGAEATVSEMQKARRKTKRFSEYGYTEIAEKSHIITLPVTSIDEGEIWAYQLVAPYSGVEILNITTPVKGAIMAYNAHFSSDEFAFVTVYNQARKIKRGDTIALITLYIKGEIKHLPGNYFRINTGISFASDAAVHICPEWEIAMPRIYINEADSNDFGSIGAHDTFTKHEITDGGKETEIAVKGGSSTSRIVTIVPNPAITTADITYNVEGNSIVTLQMFDMLGKLRSTLVFAERQQGLYRRELNVSGLAAGVYFLRLETTDGNGKLTTYVERMIVKK